MNERNVNHIKSGNNKQKMKEVMRGEWVCQIGLVVKNRSENQYEIKFFHVCLGAMNAALSV